MSVLAGGLAGGLLAVTPGLVRASDGQGANRASPPCKVAVVFDVTGKFDKSFAESAWRGVRRARGHPGLVVRELEAENPALRLQSVRVAAEGADMVITVGSEFAAAVGQVAAEFPQVRFTAIEAVVSGPNVQDVHFREQEGAFLAGAAAALMSRTQILGFIGGLDLPSIERFQGGFRAGAQFVNPAVSVLTVMAGTDTETAFRDPYAGYTAAQGVMDQGADVVFAAAGATGLGAYQAVADRQRYSIGVDTDQSELFPGSMLTAVVKHVDAVVEQAALTCNTDQWMAGRIDLGLSDWSISLAAGPESRRLLPADVRSRLEQIQQEIISGARVVPGL